LALLLASGVGAAFFLVDANQLKQALVEQLESQLQRKVSAGEAEVTIFTGLGARVRNLTVGEDPQFGATPFVRLGSLQVRLKLLPLLSGKVAVDSVLVDQPVVRLIRKPQGWNFESLSKRKDEPGSSGPAQQAPAQTSLAVAVDTLRLNEGTVWIRDESRLAASQESSYEHIFLELKGVSTRQAGNFVLRLALPEVGGQGLHMSGTLGPVDLAHFDRLPLDATVRLADVPIASLAALSSSDSSGPEWRGRITTETRLQGSAAEAFRLAGETTIDGAGTKRPGLESPEISGKLSHQLTYQMSSGSVDVQKATLQLPTSELSLLGSIEHEGKETILNLKIDSRRLSVDDALKMAAVLGGGPPKGMKARGQIELQMQAAGNLKSPDLSGQAKLSGGEVDYPGLDQKIVLSPLTLVFDKARITSNLLEVAVGQRTRLQAQLAANLATPKLLTTKLSTSGPVQIADLLAIGSTFGIRPPEGVSIQGGTLSLQAETTTPLEGTGETQTVGKATISGSQVKLPWLTQVLNINRTDLEFKGDSIAATGLVLKLAESTVTGQARISSLTAPTLQFGLKADQLNLATLDSLIAAPAAAEAPREHASIVRGFEWPRLSSIFEADLLLAAPPKSRPADPLAALTVLPSQFSVQHVRYDALGLENASSNFQMKNKVLSLDGLQFQMNRGTHTGRASFDLNDAQPSYTFNSSLTNVDANEFLSQNSSLKNLIFGQFSTELDVKGTGSAFDAITRSLKGGGKATLAKGKITSFNLLEQVALIGKLAGLNFKQGGGTEIEDMISNFRIENGRVFADMMHLRVPGASLKAKGSFGFDDTVDYQLSVELPTQAVPNAAAANPFVNLATATFFRSEQGKIVVPLRLSGTMQRPGFALDSQVVRENLTKTGKEAVKGGLDALQKAFSGKGPSGQNAAPTEDSSSEKNAAEKPSEKKASPLDLFQDLLNKAKEKKEAKEN